MVPFNSGGTTTLSHNRVMTAPLKIKKKPPNEVFVLSEKADLTSLKFSGYNVRIRTKKAEAVRNT
jgi:hypothetical protein